MNGQNLKNNSILLTTFNLGKRLELLNLAQSMAPQLSLNFEIPQQDLKVPEQGSTLWDNAFIKAQSYARHYQRVALSDDSGLFLEDFPDLMGVQTADFGGKHLNEKEKCLKLLREYESVEPTVPLTRSAVFKCVLCYYQSETNVFFFEGILKGHIAREWEDGDGFGYDPIFIPHFESDDHANSHKTLARQQDWKQLHSHRAKAMKAFFDFLKQQ